MIDTHANNRVYGMSNILSGAWDAPDLLSMHALLSSMSVPTAYDVMMVACQSAFESVSLNCLIIYL